MKMLSIQTSLRQQSKIAHMIIFRKCLILLCIVIVRNIGIKVCKILLVCVLLLLQRFKVRSAIVPFLQRPAAVNNWLHTVAPPPASGDHFALLSPGSIVPPLALITLGRCMIWKLFSLFSHKIGSQKFENILCVTHAGMGRVHATTSARWSTESWKGALPLLEDKLALWAQLSI